MVFHCGNRSCTEDLICQYERLNPKATFPPIRFHFVAAHEQGEVFYCGLKSYGQRVVGKAKAMLPPWDLIQWSPDPPPNAWQKPPSRTRSAAEALKLQPVSEGCSKTCGKHLVSFLSSACKCSTKHSHCSQGLTSFRSIMNCSKL